MKIFTHRKIIYVYLIAIFLPSLIAGYLSLSTFAKRREAVKKILESNLWISGEAALKSVEGTLLETEKTALKSENFIELIREKKADPTLIDSSAIIRDIVKQYFLLGADYNLIFPETGSENNQVIRWEKERSDSQFEQFYQKAEFYEFSQKNFAKAGEFYEKAIQYTSLENYKAISLEGLGRCLLSLNRYSSAEKVYNELSGKYGQYQNQAGHPYGIAATLQSYEVAEKMNNEKYFPGILLDLYEKIREGTWHINLPVYDFYTAEIESILKDKFIQGNFTEIENSLTEMQKQPSPYRQTLMYAEILKNISIPRIKEKLLLSQPTGEDYPERLLITSEKNNYMVSYTLLPGFQSGQTCYGGFFWDMNLLKEKILPGILKNIAKESGMGFNIVDEKGQNMITGTKETTSGESLILAFRVIPLNWKLIVSQPGIKTIEKTAQREIYFYGILLAVIVALMLFGAVLIARDISRESETTRLKTEFVNNISHEFKTPLTLIRLYGETLQLKENLTNKEKKECYEIITRESERLSHLINNVLDFSRIEMGRKEFDFKKGNMAAVIRDTLEAYSYHLEKKGFIIRQKIAGDLPEVSFDAEAIASVLINLLSNAMKFSPKEKEVTVNFFRDDGNAILQVADKGIGISQNEIPKIFQRFYQSENKISSETKGSGLGLTLVKHITEAHHGRIEVESEPGKGSIFSVILPITDNSS